MLRRVLGTLLTGVWLAALASPCAAAVCVTADCHAILGKAAVVHPPVADRDCEVCHSPTDQAHPGAGSMKLVAEGRALCLNCHDDPAKGQSFVHPPVEDGCIDCHSPHQSAHAKLLLEPGGKLCLMCHDSVTTGRKVHGPVKAANCAICHAHHAGANPGLLLQPGNGLCLACHPDIGQIIAKAKSQHEPVAKGRCWECHAPHSSNFEPLLRAYYPQASYVAYRPEQYALCFGCHDSKAFEYERTSEATGFRNRDQNLHYFHVTRANKGRVCKVCHDIHGADQPRLIATRASHFGRWEIPIYFELTPAGGSCNVGCHNPKRYDQMQRLTNN